MIEMELANIPMINFTADNRILTTIPVILESIPYFALASGFSVFLSFINSFINKFVIFTHIPFLRHKFGWKQLKI